MGEAHNYGATGGMDTSDKAEAFETFSISEPYTTTTLHGGSHDSTPLRMNPRSSSCCCCAKGESDALKIIVLSFFVFAAGVTIALIVQIASGGDVHPQPIGQTATDHIKCNEIGDRVLKSGGNAVDAAVAATFCLAVVAPHITGLGGGGTMLIHKHRDNKTTVVDFREAAPRSARSDRKFIDNPNAAQTGLNSIAIPGFVKGLDHAHAHFGSGNVECCSWYKLLSMAIAVSKEVVATENLINATHTKIEAEELKQSTSGHLRAFLYENEQPLKTNTVLYDISMFRAMVTNLERLATEGAAEFYQGSIATKLVSELSGVLTLDDLRQYTVEEREVIQAIIGEFKVLTAPAPTAGPKLLAFLGAMSELADKNGIPTVTAQYLAQVSKILEKAELFQMTLGDPTNNTKVNEKTASQLEKQSIKKLLNVVGEGGLGFYATNQISDPVSANVAVMDKEDIYVSVVTSLNTWFGSKVMTSTGILLNNAMANFAATDREDLSELPATENQRASMKRPLSANVVALAIETKKICGQRLLVGGSTADSVGEVLADSLLYKQTFKASVDRARLRVFRDSVSVEAVYEEFGEPVFQEFLKQGMNISKLKVPYTTVNGVDKYIDTVLPYSDARSGGGQAFQLTSDGRAVTL